MNNITVTITGDGKATGKTQLAAYMHEVLRNWFPKGIERPQVTVVDAEHRTTIYFDESTAAPPKEPSRKLKQTLAKIEEAGRVYNLDGPVLDCIAKSWEGADPERNGFAQEMAMQYGFAILDDNAEIYGVTAERLADMMSVLGFRTRAEREADKDPIAWCWVYANGSRSSVYSGKAPADYALRNIGKPGHAVDVEYFYSRSTHSAKTIADTLVSGLVKTLGGSIATGGYANGGNGSGDAHPRTTSQVSKPETMIGGHIAYPVPVRPGYKGLFAILVEALEQAQGGKGAERHNLGGDIPFERQRMQTISELIGSVDGMTYQACKKITEGVKLPTLDRQVAELLGAINYIAGMIIFLRAQAPKTVTVNVVNRADRVEVVAKVDATQAIDTLFEQVQRCSDPRFQKVTDAALRVKDALGLDAAKRLLKWCGAARLHDLPEARWPEFIVLCDQAVPPTAKPTDPQSPQAGIPGMDQ